MARAAELSDLVWNESKQLTEKKEGHQNLEKGVSHTSSRKPLACCEGVLVVFRSLRWAKHSITASLLPGLLWENVKNRTPHFTDSHIKCCQVQPRESSIGGRAAPVEQQEFKCLAEHKSLSEQCNMFILTTPAESESQTWKTCTAIPGAAMVLWDKTPYRTEFTWNDAGFSLFLAHL